MTQWPRVLFDLWHFNMVAAWSGGGTAHFTISEQTRKRGRGWGLTVSFEGTPLVT